MQNKMITFAVIMVLLFSLQGFSQTTEKSLHPLLDKYYPQPEAPDTNKAVTTQIKPLGGTDPLSPGKTIPAKTVTPAFTGTPVVTAPAPDKDSATATTIQSGSISSAMTTTPSVTSTTSVNKPATVTVQVPVSKKVQAQPAPGPPLDMRMGSSTKAYNTWEKNNNGAGSVTTSPK